MGSSGSVSGYYLPESIPFVMCGACLMVVLASSAEAKALYDEIVQSYELPGVQAVFDAAGRRFPGRDQTALVRRSHRALMTRRAAGSGAGKPVFPDVAFFRNLHDGVSEGAEELAVRFEAEAEHGGNPDLIRWNELVTDLVKVGFNRMAETDEGAKENVCKVTAEGSPTLVAAIVVRSLAEHLVMAVINEAELKVIKVRGEAYDLTDLLADRATTRAHRVQTKAYKESGYRLRHDESIARKACLWYKSRVEYRNPEEFCLEMYVDDVAEMYGSNVRNEIRECDEALGYGKGSMD